MKKLLQYCAEMPQFSAAGVGIMSEPLIPQGLRFYSRGSGKPTGKPWVHGRYIFRYQLDGERCFNVDGTKFNMTPGDAILIPPGARHFVESSGTVLPQEALCAAFELPAKELRLRRVCKFIFRPTVQDQKLLNNAISAFLKWLDGNAEAAGFELNESMMSMLNGFTLLRMITMAGGMLGFAMTKEQLLGLNAQLNQIPKP